MSRHHRHASREAPKVQEVEAKLAGQYKTTEDCAEYVVGVYEALLQMEVRKVNDGLSESSGSSASSGSDSEREDAEQRASAEIAKNEKLLGEVVMEIRQSVTDLFKQKLLSVSCRADVTTISTQLGASFRRIARSAGTLDDKHAAWQVVVDSCTQVAGYLQVFLNAELPLLLKDAGTAVDDVGVIADLCQNLAVSALAMDSFTPAMQKSSLASDLVASSVVAGAPRSHVVKTAVEEEAATQSVSSAPELRAGR
ncbi:MAG: hypothetical protein P1U40_06165 [Coxiellaceae bacterium]|nr:hypothetical protein [Coxiellaceae bacterium]